MPSVTKETTTFHLATILNAKIALADYILEHGFIVDNTVDTLCKTILRGLRQEWRIEEDYLKELRTAKNKTGAAGAHMGTFDRKLTETLAKLQERASHNTGLLKQALAKQADSLSSTKYVSPEYQFVTFFNAVTDEVNALYALDLLSERTLLAIIKLFARINQQHLAQKRDITLPDEPVAFERVTKKIPPPTIAVVRNTFEQLKEHITHAHLPPFTDETIAQYSTFVGDISRAFYYHPDKPHLTGDCAQEILDKHIEHPIEEMCRKLREALKLLFKDIFTDINAYDTGDGKFGTLFIIYHFWAKNIRVYFAPFGRASKPTEISQLIEDVSSEDIAARFAYSARHGWPIQRATP